MSYFSAALDRSMQARDLTQTELAKAAGVKQDQISRYLNDDAQPKPAMLELICAQLKEDAAALLTAYLRDHVPPKLQNIVEIRPAGPAPSPSSEDSARVEESGENIFAALPVRERKLLEELAARFSHNPKLLRAIQSTLELAG